MMLQSSGERGWNHGPPVPRDGRLLCLKRMNRLLAATRWYFLPGVEMAREARKGGTAARRVPMRAVIIHTLPRAFVVAAFVWSVVEADWYVAGVLGVTIVTLGLLSWAMTRWMIKRLGGTHATR